MCGLTCGPPWRGRPPAGFTKRESGTVRETGRPLSQVRPGERAGSAVSGEGVCAGVDAAPDADAGLAGCGGEGLDRGAGLPGDVLEAALAVLVLLAEPVEVDAAVRGRGRLPSRRTSAPGPASHDLRHAVVSLGSTPRCPRPRSPVARDTASRSCSRSTRCINGQAHAANQCITDALGTAEPEPAPAVKKTATASRHPEMPGQQPDAEQNGQQTAPPGGQNTAPTSAVRGFRAFRPWYARTHSGRRKPENTPRNA
jgi:hypothetical protein